MRGIKGSVPNPMLYVGKLTRARRKNIAASYPNTLDITHAGLVNELCAGDPGGLKGCTGILHVVFGKHEEETLLHLGR